MQSTTEEPSSSVSTTEESTTEETTESSSTETSSTPQSTTVTHIVTRFPTVMNETMTTPARISNTTTTTTVTRPNNYTTTTRTTTMTPTKNDTTTTTMMTPAKNDSTIKTTTNITTPSAFVPPTEKVQDIVPTVNPSFETGKEQNNIKTETVDRVGEGESVTISGADSGTNKATGSDNKSGSKGTESDLTNNTVVITTTPKILTVLNSTLTNLETNKTKNVTEEVSNKPINESDYISSINGSVKFPTVESSPSPTTGVSQLVNDIPTTEKNVKEDKNLHPEGEENETIEDKAFNFTVPAVAPVVHPSSQQDDENEIDEDDDDYEFEEDEDHSILSGETVPTDVKRRRRDLDSANTIKVNSLNSVLRFLAEAFNTIKLKILKLVSVDIFYITNAIEFGEARGFLEEPQTAYES